MFVGEVFHAQKPVSDWLSEVTVKFSQDVVLVCDNARSHSDDDGAECHPVEPLEYSRF